ncbi:hypothetical protein PRK78_000234 [Emydomyces testavorans]|uniref:Uncharacterized protein n=1 Tax=Emydomyces testavorans TaxID=2070801 RepID=A0AAF0IHH1_9EURO|nr:hypothetical protein PRK78_000234 [Emydomyces testavorans]
MEAAYVSQPLLELLLKFPNSFLYQLHYHPTLNNVLLSGSTDGLVNIYDTTIIDEDDALLQVVNHGSVHHAGFIEDKAVYALSHDESFSIHPFNDLDENVVEFSAIQFGDLRPLLHCDYVVDVLIDAGGAYAATGSTREKTLDLVPIVSSPEFRFDRGKIWRLPGAHGEEVVRSVLLDHECKIVFTCGEDGHVRIWREENEEKMQEDMKPSDIESKSKIHPDASSQAAQPSRNKEKRKENRHRGKRYKPY